MLSVHPVRCPITLDDRPLCPQITPCGHVFSFPAIVAHLVAHGGPELRKSAPCPLCYTQARPPVSAAACITCVSSNACMCAWLPEGCTWLRAIAC